MKRNGAKGKEKGSRRTEMEHVSADDPADRMLLDSEITSQVTPLSKKVHSIRS